MRDPKRISKIIQRLQLLWDNCPDLRLGQLISIAGLDVNTLFNIEDEELMIKIEQKYKRESSNAEKKFIELGFTLDENSYARIIYSKVIKESKICAVINKQRKEITWLINKDYDYPYSATIEETLAGLEQLKEL